MEKNTKIELVKTIIPSFVHVFGALLVSGLFINSSNGFETTPGDIAIIVGTIGLVIAIIMSRMVYKKLG